MNLKQIQAVLVGLLLSGGTLIPGNIPNIIAAQKLQIKSKEWAATGIPLGLGLLLIFFVILFFM
jgi:predicted cation transporter